MIIFGWGKAMTKNFGPVKTYRCGHCNNISDWNLFRVSTWFTLYFIPVFPYSFKRLLVCPICGAYHELSKQEFEELKPDGKTRISDNTSSSKAFYNSIEDGTVIQKTETQLNYLRQMEELERERQQKLQNTNPDTQ